MSDFHPIVGLRARQAEELSKVQDACCHEATSVRKRIASDGRPMYTLQCVSCGQRPDLRFIKRVDAFRMCNGTEPPDFDEVLFAAQRERMESMRLRHLDERRDIYADYLQSEQWKNLRGKVLRRADGVCEACGDAPAAQVHHLTYERVGREMLFDLAAVCLECHAKAHEGRA